MSKFLFISEAILSFKLALIGGMPNPQPQSFESPTNNED